jgi:hypothetical protein
MNFTEVVNQVIATTLRPDKINDIRNDVNAAVNFCCAGTDFARDLQERSITIDSGLYAQSMLLSEFTRFRKFKYLRPTNRNKYLTLADPAKIFSPRGCEEVDTYYIAGDQVNYKLGTLASTMYIGWFAYPPTLTDAAPTFWLLEAAPFMIIDWAIAKTFRSIGDDTSATKHENFFKVAYEVAVRDLKFGATPN